MRSFMFKKLLSVVVFAVMIPAYAYSQSGGLSGQVTDSSTGEPLTGAIIFIQELQRGATTDLDGRYALANVRPGTYQVRISFVGFRPRVSTITVAQTVVTLDASLEPDPFGLGEVVVTGVLGDTDKAKLPFSVGRITSRELELVPATSAEGSIRGKIPGVTMVRGSGQPGSATSIVLRSPTTMTGNNSPLYIVDGVILAASTVDVDALDIETIEVVKGAAAASLYGSRAANGVVQITTKRGNLLPDNTAVITLRNEYGISQLANKVDLAQNHAFTMNSSQTRFVDANGNELPLDVRAQDAQGNFYRARRTSAPPAVNFQDKPFPTPLYDNLDRFFSPGTFMTNYLSLSQRVSNLNYTLSFSNSQDSGVLEELDGYGRRNVRLNVDGRLSDRVNLGVSTYYANSSRDVVPTGPGSPFFGLLFSSPDVDLAGRDSRGYYNLQPDPTNIEENPLYEVSRRELIDYRTRFSSAVDLRYRPVDELVLTANLSYDRSNREFYRFWPIDWEQIGQNTYFGGGVQRQNAHDEAYNASINATFSKRFGDLSTRTQVRYLYEQSLGLSHFGEGREFTVAGAPQLQNTSPDKRSISSSETDVRFEGIYLITNLDYADKYIGDFLIRRDGSSLFGADERYHNYYRASVAYRVSEEEFMRDISIIDELKLRYSIGTAGGLPSFTAQYETWSISAGSVFKGVLGNRNLKPEKSQEQEFGFEISLANKLFLDLTYAMTTTTDQLLQVPLPAVAGFGSQWQNAGTVESTTFEASLRYIAYQSRDMGLSFNFLYDRSKAEITEFNRPAFRYGAGTQSSDVFYYRKGETFGVFYGNKFATNASTLPRNLRPAAGTHFQVNDDGYMVPVGQGNSWNQGIASNLWGTMVAVPTYDANGNPTGQTVNLPWGIPVKYVNDEGQDFVKIGQALPKFNAAFGTNFRYKGLTAYLLFEGQFGGNIYNQSRQWLYRDLRAGEMDQGGKADANKKTVLYYQTLYNTNNSSSHFVEDGTYVKLRELALRYTFSQENLQPVFGNAIKNLTLSVIGRNLLTFTDYSGFDPEVGATGQAALIRFDGFNYPNFRTITGSIEIQF